MTSLGGNRLWPTLLLMVLGGCDKGTLAEGVIKTEQGRPVEGAAVTLTYRSRTGMPVASNEKGSYSIAIVHEPGRRVLSQLSVSADGYEPVRVALYGTARYSCDFTLRPAPTGQSTPRVVPLEQVCRKRE